MCDSHSLPNYKAKYHVNKVFWGEEKVRLSEKTLLAVTLDNYRKDFLHS